MAPKPESWKIGVRRPSTVHFLKLIQDLRDQFPYNALTAFIVETFANSLDAGSTRIDIFVGKDDFKILDNGKGMNEAEFTDYHNLASLSKTRGESIGFAGVGAKIFLDKVYHIFTETKCKKFHAASLWAFHGESLEYESRPIQNRVPYENGTYVEVKLKDSNDVRDLTILFVKDTLQQHYNAVLQGLYGEKRITVNNEIVKPFTQDPETIEAKKEFIVKIGRNEVKGLLIKSKKEICESFQGPQIIVHGKTIISYWFKQYPTHDELFTGMIFADFLINILTTSKSDFDKTSKLWKQFNNRVGKVVGAWLVEIGAKDKPIEPSDKLSSLSQEIEKTINELLKLPEFTEIANKLFQNLMERNIVKRNDSGEIKGVEQEGSQPTKGSLESTNIGGGLPTFGPNDGVGILENDQGEETVERLRRRVKGGIKISYIEKPDELLEAWVDPSTQTVTINRGHPSWKVAEKLNLDAKSEQVTAYHMLRSIFKVLAEEANVESPDKTIRDLLQSLYERLPGIR
jgi:hypothetical protein